MVVIDKAHEIDKTGMKDTYGQVLCDLARNDENVVYLDADLARPSGALDTFGRQFPERFFDCGIQEANMMGVANGLSAGGMVPFVHTFSCFVARKCLDSIFLTGCFAKQNVKIIGSDPGVTAEQNGASHAGLEDMGVLRNIPNIILVDPCDPVMFEAVLRRSKDMYGMFYIRYNRKAVKRIYKKGTAFEFGKGHIIRDGKDVSIIASGMMVSEALEAAELLESKGVYARVVDMFTWKPLDTELVIHCAKETGAIVTAENHNVMAGLGSAVASVVVGNYSVPVEMIGIYEQFGQVGMLKDQKEFYNLRAEDIAQKAMLAISRK